MADIELCIRDKDGNIVAWQVGYSEEEIDKLLEKHKKEGWCRSYAENTLEGYR